MWLSASRNVSTREFHRKPPNPQLSAHPQSCNFFCMNQGGIDDGIRTSGMIFHDGQRKDERIVHYTCRMS
jgi:hypothetical protein